MSTKLKDPPRSNNPRKFLACTETLREEEWNRRRLLRLEQVREQSKDIAQRIRQNVRKEREKQLCVANNRKTARVQQWQAQKLRALQSEYHSTMKNIGSSHTEAAKQPNVEEERKKEAERILQAAHKRGQEALLQLREEENERRKVDEARRMQQQHVRSVEEARSAAVVSLPLPDSTVSKSTKVKKSVSIATHPVSVKGPSKKSASGGAEGLQNEQAWPVKHWPQSTLPLGVVESQSEERGEQVSNMLNRDDCSSKDSTNLKELAAVSSVHPSCARVEEQSSVPTSSRVNKNAEAPSSVRTSSTIPTTNDVKLYDHMNRYQQQYDKHLGLVERVERLSGEPNAHELAEEAAAAAAAQNSVSHDLQKREHIRSRQALHRAYVQRDYKELMGSLAVLAKQRAALTSFTSATTAVLPGRDIDRQKQMNTAVEELLPEEHAHGDSVQGDLPLPDTPDGSLLMSRFGDTPGTVPKLNVGSWASTHAISVRGQQFEPYHKSLHNTTPSDESVESIILAPARQPLQPSGDGKELRNERNSALRSLLQHINDEREQILGPQYHTEDQQQLPLSQSQPWQETQQHKAQQQGTHQRESQQRETRRWETQWQETQRQETQWEETQRQETAEQKAQLQELQDPLQEEPPEGGQQKQLLHFQKPLTGELKSLHQKLLQQREQLEEQRGEVCRLDERIVVPECNHSNSPFSEGGTDSHESIVIEPSYSSNTQDTGSGSTSHEISPSQLCTTTAYEGDVISKKKSHKASRRKQGEQNAPEDISAAKTKNDSNIYSMDVSLSSVTMDHTTNSSSGSQSVSLHGVQVLVKVSGLNGNKDQSRHDEIDFSCNKGRMLEADSGSREIKPPLSQNLSVSNTKEYSDFGQTLHISDLAESQDGSFEVRQKSKRKREKPFSKPSHDHHARLDQQRVNRKEGSGKSIDVKKKKDTKRNIPAGAKPKDLPSPHPEVLIDAPTSASTSYLSPPDHILSSLSKDIQSLLAIARNGMQPEQRNGTITQISQQQKGDPVDVNPMLTTYINRLLAMSRESIDRLNVSCSEVSTPPSNIFDGTGTEASFLGGSRGIDGYMSATTGPSSSPPNKDDDLTPPHQSVDDGGSEPSEPPQEGPLEWLIQPTCSDQGSLTDLTKQCHDRISALTKMIEEVRRQAVLNSPHSNYSTCSGYSNQSVSSPLPVDSTAYMSPPPKVLDWVDMMVPPQSLEGVGDKTLYDPYSVAIRQLLADVRSQMTSEPGATGDQVSNPLQDIGALQTVPQSSDLAPPTHTDKLVKNSEVLSGRPKPPVAFWRNLDRCNISSPTEPHELSTIPELGVTLPDSTGSQSTVPGSPQPSSPTAVSTPPDVMAELIRRKIMTSPFSWTKNKNTDEDISTQQRSHCSNSSNSTSLKSSNKESDVSPGYSRTGRSDMSSSKEASTVSHHSLFQKSDVSHDWNTNALESPLHLYSSADEIEGDFRRMGLGWVGAMMRKTKEAGALSSSSSSEFMPVVVATLPPADDTDELKDVSEIVEEDLIISGSPLVDSHQGRCHSTPVKQIDVPSMSSSSHVSSGDSRHSLLNLKTPNLSLNPPKHL